MNSVFAIVGIVAGLLAAASPRQDGGTPGLGDLTTYGPYAIVLYIILRDVIPFIRDKLYPDIAAARKEHQAASIQQLRQNLDLQQKFIDSLHSMNISQAALASQITHLVAEFKEAERYRSEDRNRIAEALEIVKEDLAALYGKLDQPRPSRVRDPSRRELGR